MLDLLANLSTVHLILLGLGSTLGLLVLPRLFSSPVYGTSAVLLLTIIEAWIIQMPYVELGLQIYPHDLLFVGLFFFGLSRVLFVSGVRSVPLSWYLFGSLIFISLILGITQHGPAAGVDCRDYFYYLAGTLYFLSFTYRESDVRHISNVWLAASAVLVGIVLFRWTAELVGLGIPITWREAIPFRVIDAGQTWVVGIGLVLLIHRAAYGLEGVSRPLIVVFVVVVMGLQHRSVWVATTVAVLSLMFIQGSPRARLLGNLAVMGLIGAFSLAPLLLLGMLDSLVASVVDSAERARDLSADTFGWRVEGWQLLLSSWLDWDLISKLIGEPFGSGYDSGREVSPHNYYIQTLLRTGLLGLAALLALFGHALVRLLRETSRESDGVYHALLFAMIVNQLVYYVPYGIKPEHGIILGIAISLARFSVGYKQSRAGTARVIL